MSPRSWTWRQLLRAHRHPERRQARDLTRLWRALTPGTPPDVVRERGYLSRDRRPSAIMLWWSSGTWPFGVIWLMRLGKISDRPWLTWLGSRPAFAAS